MWAKWEDLENQAREWLEVGDRERACRAARLAIEFEPNSVDSYVVLAQASDVMGERIAFSREAVRLGEILFADELADAPSDDFPFWAVFDTRPYMRALHTLMMTLWQDERPGAQDEAIEIALHMVRICPGDNLGIRYVLPNWLARKDRWDEGRAFVNSYEEEYAIELKMWAALFEYKANEQDRAAGFVQDALKINPHTVKQLLLKRAPKISRGMLIEIGSRDEAKAHASCSYDLWRKIPGAVDWLKSQSSKPA